MNEMKSRGIDVVALEWNDNAVTRDNIYYTTIPAINNSNMSYFVMLYDLSFRFGQAPNFNQAVVRNTITSDFQTFATDGKYFKNGKYLKLGNNKPVVYFYTTRIIQGSEANIRSTFDSLQSIARANGFGGVYVVADQLYWGSINYDMLRQIGASAVTCFAPADSSQGVPMDLPQDNPSTRPMRTWADKLSDLYRRATSRLQSYTQGIDMQPGIFRPVRRPRIRQPGMYDELQERHCVACPRHHRLGLHDPERGKPAAIHSRGSRDPIELS